MSLRVVVLDHTAQPGGAELALERAVAAIGDRAAVHVVLFADGPLVGRMRAVGAGVEVLPLDAAVAGRSRHELGGARAVLRALRVIPFEVRLARRLRRLRPDVVHTTSLKADLLGVLPALAARRPLVWHVHDRIAADYLPARAVRLVRWVAGHVPAAVVANSRATASTLPGVRVLRVVPPGLAPEQVRSAPRPTPDGLVIGLVGRISPTKGQRELVHAMPRILARYPAARLRFVGAPLFGADDYAAEVRAEADRLGVAHAVTWVGHTEDVAGELDTLAVCVHASPVPEPYGQVVAEALARGVPVVATRAGGVPEILGAWGTLVPPGDADALADAVLGVLDARDDAERRAREAHAYAAEHLGVDRTAEGLLSVWRQVAAGRARRS